MKKIRTKHSRRREQAKSAQRTAIRRGYAKWARWIKAHPESDLKSVARFCGGWMCGNANETARQMIKRDRELARSLKARGLS